MAKFFKLRSVRNSAINHRIAGQLWSEIVKAKGRSDGELPAFMSDSPRGVQLADRHQIDGMSVYIRELENPHRVLAYPVAHTDLRAAAAPGSRLDWAALAKLVPGGRAIVVAGETIKVENASVDVARARQNPEYLEMVLHQKEVTDRFGPLFRNPSTLTEADFRSFLAFENNHHWTGLHRQFPNLLEQGIDHLRETVAVLTDESRPIAERYDIAVERQKGMSKGIATAILMVAAPNRYGVWNATSEAGLIELGEWPELPRGATEGQKYAAVNNTLNSLTATLGVDLWSLDGLLHFILYPNVGPSEFVATQRNKNADDDQLLDRMSASPSASYSPDNVSPEGIAYWWVNNGQTYTHEIGGNYLWSPIERSDGVRNEFYDNMKRVRAGDVVFAFAGGDIKAIGVCSAPVVLAPKPGEFGAAGTAWGTEGWRLKVDFTRLSAPLSPKDHMDILAPTLPEKYSPIRPDGKGNQGAYLAAVPVVMANAVIDLLGPRWAELNLGDATDPASLIEAIETSEEQVERALRNRTDLGETEKLQLVKSRRGQGIYRQNLEGFEQACRITGVSNPRHLRASHIKPWRASTTFEKLDGNNGLLLSPHVDHLFDQGFISFADDGALLVSPQADLDTLRSWGVETEGNFASFRPQQQPYLAFHREFIFRR